jgi:hypothetical protein
VGKSSGKKKKIYHVPVLRHLQHFVESALATAAHTIAVGQDVGRGLACTIYHSTVPPNTSPASRCYHARLRLFGCQHPKFRAKPSEK